jgi:hypothetical protein
MKQSKKEETRKKITILCHHGFNDCHARISNVRIGTFGQCFAQVFRKH